MFHSLGVAIALTIGASVHAAESPALAPETRALIEPTLQQFKAIDSEYSALPPTTDVAEELIRMGRKDQAIRLAYSKIDFAKLMGEQRTLAFNAVYGEIDRRDADHQKALVSLLPPEGWFAKSKYGAEATTAAWLVVQHSIRVQPDLIRTLAPAMERMLITNDIDKTEYAKVVDRLATMDGRYQVYGTQMVCHASRWVAYPIGDRATVNQRRREMGIPETVDEMIASMASRTCPAEWVGKLPPGAALGAP